MADVVSHAGDRDTFSQWSETVTTNESDEQLAARVTTDVEAFAELYRRYSGPVRRYCAFRIDDQSTVEDITSQVFVQVLEGLRNTRVTSVRSWIFTIAHHKIVDLRRRRRDVRPIDESAELPSRSPGPEELALIRSDIEQLRTAIASLTRDQQRVIELRLSGLDGPEIRQVLGRSRSWVDTTQYRALIRLRTLMNADQPPEVG